MDIMLLLGLIGGIVLIVGAARSNPQKNILPVLSVKNRLLLLGAIIMLSYALLGYFQGDSLFFVLLEGLIIIAGVLMMINTKDKIDTIVLSIAIIALLVWSLFLFDGYTTIIFILGCGILALGYAFDGGTVRRDMALTVGSILIAWFSLLSLNWVFFGLNIFFALFSGYHRLKDVIERKK